MILPWKKDLIEQVPSNHKVALSVLNRVTESLEKKGLLEDYQNVFHSQCEEGIIEKIEVEPKDFKNYVWIPHRPVIKDDPVTTTKIRPVFNCSLKTGNKPSLNEAAFVGINLWVILFSFLCISEPMTLLCLPISNKHSSK